MNRRNFMRGVGGAVTGATAADLSAQFCPIKKEGATRAAHYHPSNPS